MVPDSERFFARPGGGANRRKLPLEQQISSLSIVQDAKDFERVDGFVPGNPFDHKTCRFNIESNRFLEDFSNQQACRTGWKEFPELVRETARKVERVKSVRSGFERTDTRATAKAGR